MPSIVATIGFTKTSAQGFFTRLTDAGVKRVIDVRLHNTSQLAGFAKAEDLGYFLKQLGGIDYVHEPLLAPTDAMLKTYRTEKTGWDSYAERFLDLLRERRIERLLSPEGLDRACLLCSEASAHHCHRRLVVDYLNEQWGGTLAVTHL